MTTRIAPYVGPLFLLAAALATVPVLAADASDTNATREQARVIVAKLTLDEKIQQLHGAAPLDTPIANAPTTGPIEHLLVMPRRVDGIARLDIPTFYVTNGPSGVAMGDADPQKPATALPSAISLAATWNIETAQASGKLIGSESVALGNGMLEAPTINIARLPQNGRTFEAYGEDPLLVGMISTANIRGAQAEKAIVNVKHYAANNQETDRFTVNEIIDERTLREVYLQAFERAVKVGKVASLMCAYPKVNGTFSCENKLLLDQILRREWGFDGFVSSDFFAVHSTVPTALAGVDLEMPNGLFFGEKLKQAVVSGELPESALDEKLVRRYAKMIEFDYFGAGHPQRPISADANAKIARALAAEGMVLLKNDAGLLPLDSKTLQRIALIGPQALAAATGGGGSSKVVALSTISPLDGLKARAGRDIQVTLDDGSDPVRAAALAKAADVTIVMIGEVTSEGSDHPLNLPESNNRLVDAVLAANPRTVVVLKTGSAVLMPWIDKVGTLLEAWYPGQADGAAVAEVLFGDVNPSGRLPLTFPARTQDLPVNTQRQWPGIDGEAHYSEGIFIGYRHFDQRKIEPLFPFGHGLSYTTFAFANLDVSPLGSEAGTGFETAFEIGLDVSNTGKRRGAEVVQVYLGIPSTKALPQPPQRLAGFAKVELDPGETRRVTIPIEARALASWDVVRHDWALPSGPVQVLVGASSRNILLRSSITPTY